MSLSPMEPFELEKFEHFLPSQQEAATKFWQYKFLGVGGAMGGGKIVSEDSRILTPFGWKNCKDLMVNDLICNPDGTVQKIIQIKPWVRLPKYTVKFTDGTSLPVASDHLWTAWRGCGKRKIGNKVVHGESSAEVVETRTFIEWMKKGYAPLVPVNRICAFNGIDRHPEIDKYLLGVFLGDGCSRATSLTISCADSDKSHYLGQFGLEDFNHKTSRCIRIIGKQGKVLREYLKKTGLYGKKSYEKFIPKDLLFASTTVRLALAQGLMDTDGYSAPDKNLIYYYSTSKRLAEDAAHLFRSLGSVVTMTVKENTGYRKPSGKCRDCHVLTIKNREPDSLMRMKRKQHGFSRSEIFKTVSEVIVEGEVTGRCITVSNPNGLYITDDFIVTHNSYWIRCMAVEALLYYFARYRQRGVQVGVFCEDFPALQGRHISKVKEHYPPWLGTWVEARKSFELAPEYGNGVIRFLNLNEPSKYDSEEFAAIFIDEGQKQRRNDFNTLRRRLRWPQIGDDCHFAVTFNPPKQDEDAWARELFVDRQFHPDEKESARFSFVPFPPKENQANLPSSYFDQFSGMSQAERAAYLDGDQHAFDSVLSTEGWRPLLTSPQVEDHVTRRLTPAAPPTVLGIDPGGGGDATSAVLRDAFTAEVVFSQPTKDTLITIPLFLDIIRSSQVTDVVIDKTGLGWNYYTRFKEVVSSRPDLADVRVHGISFGEKSRQPKRFKNLKAELFFSLREWVLDGHFLIFDDQAPWKQLIQVRWKETSDRIVEIEKKEELLSRGIASPNEADSLALSFFPNPKPSFLTRTKDRMAQVWKT